MPRPSPAVLAALTALLLPGFASAKVPDPRFSTIDPILYGSPAGDRAYRVVIRDVSNAPIQFRVVTLDFSGSSLRLYTTGEAGTTLNAADKTLSRFSAPDGSAVFHARFGGACNAADVLVQAEGVWLGHVPARSTDIDAANGGVELGDLSRFAAAYQGLDHPELDFDGSGGAIGLGDFAIIARDYASGVKGEYCP
jgi:hypothetical protein